MRFKPDQAAIGFSAPLMVAGLVAAAVADGWAMRLGGAAMVIGASTALALTDSQGRRLAWIFAAAGGFVVLAGCI